LTEFGGRLVAMLSSAGLLRWRPQQLMISGPNWTPVSACRLGDWAPLAVRAPF